METKTIDNQEYKKINGLTKPITCDTCGKRITNRKKGWIKFKGLFYVFLGKEYNTIYGTMLNNINYDFYHYFCSFQCFKKKIYLEQDDE